MIYFYLLIPVLLGAGIISISLQHIFGDFVDLHRVERHVVGALVIWALLGWAMEQGRAEEVVGLFEICEANIQSGLRDLDARVWELLGG